MLKTQNSYKIYRFLPVGRFKIPKEELQNNNIYYVFSF